MSKYVCALLCHGGFEEVLRRFSGSLPSGDLGKLQAAAGDGTDAVQVVVREDACVLLLSG